MDATLQSFLIAVSVLLFVFLIMFVFLIIMRIKDKKAVLDLSDCKGENYDYHSYIKIFSAAANEAKYNCINIKINIRHENVFGCKTI